MTENWKRISWSSHTRFVSLPKAEPAYGGISYVRDLVLQRLVKHFRSVLNKRGPLTILCLMRSHSGTRQVVYKPTVVCHRSPLRYQKQMSSGKSPGADSIPSEIYKRGGEQLLQRLMKLCERIWDQETVIQDFKDFASIHPSNPITASPSAPSPR